MGWASGFQAGSNMAKQWIDTYNQAGLQRDLTALDEERKKGLVEQTRAPTVAEQAAGDAYLARINAGDAQTFGMQPDEQAAYQQGGLGPQTVQTRSYLGRDYGTARPTDTDMQRDYFTRKAEAYNRWGQEARADAMDERIRQMTRDAEADRRWGVENARAEKSAGLQNQLTQYHINAAERDEEQAKKEVNKTNLWDNALESINANYTPKNGFKEADRVAAIKATYENIYGPEKAMEMSKRYDDAAISKLNARAMEIKNGFSEALRTGGLDGAVKWYASVNNGSDAKVIRGKNGVAVIEHDPNDMSKARVVANGKTERDALMQLEAVMTPGGALELAKTEADMAYKKAAAYKDTKEGDWYGRRPISGDGEGLIKIVLPQVRAERLEAKKSFEADIEAAGKDPAKIKAAQSKYRAKMDEIDTYYGQYGAPRLTGGVGGRPNRDAIISMLNTSGWTADNVAQAKALTGENVTAWPEYAEGYKKQGLGPQSSPKASPTATPPAQQTPTQSPQEEAEAIRKRLSVDDQIKSGVGGSLGRAIKLKTMPLSIAERNDLERRLKQLDSTAGK